LFVQFGDLVLTICQRLGKNGEDKTQSDVAEAADITEVTVRNRCKGLSELLKN